MPTGTVHLIPNVLCEDGIYVIPNYMKALVTEIKIWYVEDLKSARRFLKKMNREIIIDDLTFYVLNEHENESLQFAKKILLDGNEIGMMSESGCPGVADPGSELVALAHEMGASVKPHVGPNSILLTLMGSGFNGQHFTFHGYLPNKQPFLTQKIQALEKESMQTSCAMFFIETPYRNHQLLTEIIKCCHPETMLCIGIDLTSADEKIISVPIKRWKTTELSFHKKPAVFGLFVKK
ncbi:MAG: SAM-dependent methyltransferase [Bacteroidetes bacterium]|nr:SAM-dependent methyltransferase [Bacteroidota bacterium]